MTGLELGEKNVSHDALEDRVPLLIQWRHILLFFFSDLIYDSLCNWMFRPLHVAMCSSPAHSGTTRPFSLVLPLLHLPQLRLSYVSRHASPQIHSCQQFNSYLGRLNIKTVCFYPVNKKCPYSQRKMQLCGRWLIVICQLWWISLCTAGESQTTNLTAAAVVLITIT